MSFNVVRPDDLEFAKRPHEPDEAPRYTADVTTPAALQQTRANFFRYEPGARGTRHADMVQEETYVPVQGTMTMYLGDPPERHEVPPGGLINVAPGTARQVVNEGDGELLVYIYGAPPERGDVRRLDSAV
jgi:quercetin dioxygenase-like cupin family protein